VAESQKHHQTIRAISIIHAQEKNLLPFNPYPLSQQKNYYHPTCTKLNSLLYFILSTPISSSSSLHHYSHKHTLFPSFCLKMMSATASASARNRSPFTPTQWQELEQQALVFKYMVTGTPIPPDLIYSIKRSLDSSISSRLFPHHPSKSFAVLIFFQVHG